MMLYEGSRWICWNLGLVSDARIHKSNSWLKTSWDSRIQHTIVIKFLVYVFLGKVWFLKPFPKSYDVLEMHSWKNLFKVMFCIVGVKIMCLLHYWPWILVLTTKWRNWVSLTLRCLNLALVMSSLNVCRAPIRHSSVMVVMLITHLIGSTFTSLET